MSLWPTEDRSSAADRRGTREQLAAIRAIVGAYLGQLDTDDMLGEIVRRLALLLDVDAAIVLLREADSDVLVARAAHGVAGSVRQGLRVPIGAGFAGTVAARSHLRILDHVDETTVLDPLLSEQGIQSMIGVPLLDAKRVVGVLQVGSSSARRFTFEEARSLQFVADLVAGAVASRTGEIERVTARALQRSLLPSRLPRCPGVAFATRYVPAEEGGVGGDWYDAFCLPTGELWLMVGDVVGHGLMPAVIMGRLRSALRSYALEGHGPEEVLALADRKLRFFEEGAMATVLVALLLPPYDRIRLSSAGHLPPVLATPAGAPGVVRVPVAPPLGIGFERPAQSATVEFPPGATLVAFTDGLIERRDESLDDGLRRLVDAVAGADGPEALCGVVMDTLVGRHGARDDIALVAVRRDPQQPLFVPGRRPAGDDAVRAR